MKLWDPRTGKLLRTLEGHTATYQCNCRFSPDGRSAAPRRAAIRQSAFGVVIRGRRSRSFQSQHIADWWMTLLAFTSDAAADSHRRFGLNRAVA